MPRRDVRGGRGFCPRPFGFAGKPGGRAGEVRAGRGPGGESQASFALGAAVPKLVLLH